MATRTQDLTCFRCGAPAEEESFEGDFVDGQYYHRDEADCFEATRTEIRSLGATLEQRDAALREARRGFVGVRRILSSENANVEKSIASIDKVLGGCPCPRASGVRVGVAPDCPTHGHLSPHYRPDPALVVDGSHG